MKLQATVRDRDANSGSPMRRVEKLELEAEGAFELELLGQLAALLASTGPTTAAAVKELVEKASPKLALDG